MSIPYKDMINKAYKAFNARDLDTMLMLMHPKIVWPNGWQGGFLRGREQVKNYWINQWKHIDPNVKPIAFKEKTDGRIEVIVHQVVKDLQGNIRSDSMIRHIYSFEDDLVKSMDIESD